MILNPDDPMDFEDYHVFGETWVYCNQHMKPHMTGWCTVSVRDKIGLGIEGKQENAQEAYAKARLFGLPIYGE